MSKKFPKESIPNSDYLYMRIHKNNYRDDEILPVCFKNNDGGMSTDWSKYSTPKQTQNRVSNYGRDPKNYGVVNLHVDSVRKVKDQIVDHTPDDDNQSHTDVLGEKPEEVRLLLRRISNWKIPVPENDD